MQVMPYAKHRIRSQDIEAVARVLYGPALTKGAAVAGFEDDLGAYVNQFAVTVNSGTAALHLALMALGDVGVGNQVLIPSLTFAGVANIIRHVGAEPVFADVLPDTLCIDPESVRKALQKHQFIRAVIATDYAGAPCNYKYLREICDFYNVHLISDACHSFGAFHIGEVADISCASFHPAKIITTGEGGALFTKSRRIASAARILRDHGITVPVDQRTGPNYDIARPGFNYRMPDINAALGSSQLKDIGLFLRKRRDLVNNYMRLFKGSERIKPIAQPENSANHIFVVECIDNDINRDNLYAELRNKGIGVAVHYPLIHKMTAHAPTWQHIPLPVSEQKQPRILTLPLFVDMTKEQQVTVCNLLNEAISNKPR